MKMKNIIESSVKPFFSKKNILTKNAEHESKVR